MPPVSDKAYSYRRNLRTAVLTFLQSRMLVLGLLVIAQVIIVVVLVMRLSQVLPYLTSLLGIFSLIIIGFLLTRDMHPAYKIVWAIIILLLPAFGGIFYLIFGSPRNRITKKGHEDDINRTPVLRDGTEEETIERLRRENEDAALQAEYLLNVSDEPVYDRTTTEYFPNGETAFSTLLEDISKAQHYIFIEFFIVEKGWMLDQLLKVLEDRIKAGVEVRFMYDDVGTAFRLKNKFVNKLKERGIQALPFSPKNLNFSFVLNTRNHRKTVVIDGVIGYTGGINIADEYANLYERFGYWKDTMVRIEGDATWSMAIGFLKTWDLGIGKPSNSFAQYKPALRELPPADGYVQPYSDNSPITGIPTGKQAYINVLQDAKRYIWIATPYLVLDYDTAEALCTAAQMGIDVRIVTPGIPDKRVVYEVTRFNYAKLVRAGVRIFEYSPGFLHAKQMLCDGTHGILGTVNFDFRSFYLHLECGVWMYNTHALEEMEQDFINMFEDSYEVTIDDIQAVPWWRRIMRALFASFSPLL